MELLNQLPPRKIVLKVEELTRKYDSYCVDCGRDIPEDTLHFRRLPCKCQYHSHCVIQAILRDGVTEDGSFRCRNYLRGHEDYYYLVDDSSQDNWIGIGLG